MSNFFIKFLNSIRCAKASELLKHTDKSVAAIAFEVGYEDLSTFYRAFKKIYKAPPKAMIVNSGK
jgi:AraC-like DNA-binding protein